MFKVHFLFILVLISGSLWAQPIGIEWERNYGGTATDKANQILATPDGGFIVVGDTYSEDLDIANNNGSSDIWVVKLSLSGDIEWQKTYGGLDFDFGEEILATNDGGYIIVGYTLSNDGGLMTNNGLHDYILVKIDSDGILEWQKTYGGTDYDYGRFIIQTNDGGYMLAGSSYSAGQQFNSFLDILVYKLTADGEVEWEENFGGSQSDSVEGICQNSDGSYVIVGTTSSRDGDISVLHSASDYWLLKISEEGELLWEKSYGGGTGFNRLSDFIVTEDGGYVLAGRHGGMDYWILKTDSLGRLEWQSSFGGSQEDVPSIIIQTRDGGFIVGGVTQSDDGDVSSFAGISDIWLVRLDKAGSMLWEKTYGGTKSDNIESIIQLEDDSYIMAGSSSSSDGDVSSNSGSLDVWLVKLFAEPTSISESSTQSSIRLYPNPTSELLNVDVQEKATYFIVNTTGQKVAQGKLNLSNKIINVKHLESGTYFLNLETASGTKITTVVKE